MTGPELGEGPGEREKQGREEKEKKTTLLFEPEGGKTR